MGIPVTIMAEHLCGGVWLNSPPSSPAPSTSSPARSPGQLLGPYLQTAYHEDELRRSKVPAAYWTLRDIIQDENPHLSIANGPELPGVESILWLLDRGDR